MKPNTRLLIRLTFEDGSMKSWGYDQKFVQSTEKLHQSIETDFAELPDHTAIHLFYYMHEADITGTTAEELADAAIAWLQSTGDYY